MLLLKSLSGLFFFTLMTTTNVTGKPAQQATLEGVVTYKATGKPASNVYLYTIKGEEEALTNERGEFRFRTGQKLPLTLYVQQDDTVKMKVVVANPARKLTIQL
jgi:hypothetical protein